MEFVPAPFWRRLVARTIDLLVCIPLTFLAVIPVVLILVPVMWVVPEGPLSSLGAFLAFFVAYSLVEYFLLRRRHGQTLGKGLLGLRVLEVTDKDGSGSVTGRSAVLRMLVLMGPLMAALAAYYLGYDDVREVTTSSVAEPLLQLWLLVLAGSAVFALVDRRVRRGLHDAAAGTRVVRAPKRGIDVKEDLKMLVPGRVSLEKHPAPPVVLTKNP